MADGSGDIYYEGNGEKIRAGLEDPRDATQAIGVWEIERGSICGSGINRRKWGKYNHVVDPLASGSVSGDIQAVWVKSDKAVLSDALATCLFFVDPEVLRQEYDFEYLILNNEYKIKHSAGMKAELFYK
jgi:thiamine biosynthesis lipoprotein